MNFSFTLLLDGANPLAPANLDKLFESGCDDATFGERDGVYVADFDREAETFSGALLGAIRSIESAVPGLRVLRVEPENLVTASEVADRLGRSRESVRLLFEGKRGEGDFPRPAAWLSDRTRLWRWTDICTWSSEHDEPRADQQWSVVEAKCIEVTNSFLSCRQALPERAFLTLFPARKRGTMSDLLDSVLSDVEKSY